MIKLKAIFFQGLLTFILLAGIFSDLYFQISNQVFEDHITLVLSWFVFINTLMLLCSSLLRYFQYLVLNYLSITVILFLNIVCFKLIFYYIFNFSNHFPNTFFEFFDITSNSLSALIFAFICSLIFAKFIVSPSKISTIFCTLISLSLIIPNLKLVTAEQLVKIEKPTNEYLKKTYSIINRNLLDEEIKLPKITKKSNIYIMIFDSLIHPNMINKHFNSKAATSNISAKKLPFTGNFDSYDNLYSEFDTSNYSFDSMLRFSLNNYVDNYPWGSIRGEKRSGFYDLFSRSGYQLHHYFGNDLKGRIHEQDVNIWNKDEYPFIHKFWFYEEHSVLRNSLTCINSELGHVFHRLKGIGMCKLLGKFSNISQVFESIIYPGRKYEKTRIEQIYMVLDQLTKNINIPKVVSLSIQGPIGHTHEGYNHKDLNDKKKYKNFYLKQENIVAEAIIKYTNLIHSRDPDGLILYFGDHGPNFFGDWSKYPLRRHINQSKMNEIANNLNSDDLELFVESRLKVFFGIAHNKNKCATEKKFSYYKAEYLTPPRVVYSIAKCMSSESQKNIKYSNDFFVRNPMIMRYLKTK